MQSRMISASAASLLLIAVSSVRANLTYSYEYLSARVEAGGLQVPDQTLTFIEQVYDDTLEAYYHDVWLSTNTLTGMGGCYLDLGLVPDSNETQYIDAMLYDLQAELTDGDYSKVFSQGDSHFQFWVKPRDKDYEYVVRVTKEHDDGLVAAYLPDGSRSFDSFAVLEGVGYCPQGEEGMWYFVGTLAAGNDYHWYGGVRAAAESEGPVSGPLNARVLVEFTLLPEPDDYTWIGPDGGLFANSANWSPSGGPPWENGRAIFNSPNGADQTVSFDQDDLTARLLVTAPAGQNTSDQLVFDLDGWNYAILREWNDVNRASLTIGNTANATANLAIIDGYVDAKDVEIGLDGTGQLTIGEDGLFTAFEHGVSVGTQGFGSLNVVDGGWVHHGHGYVGQFPGSQGSITVDGTKPSDPNVRSYWQAGGWLGLGDQGEGSLYVTSGADAETGKCDMACNPGSTGMADISGDGSQWELQSYWEVSLIVGKSGSASVTTWDGGSLVNRGEMHLAEMPGSTGSLVLNGPGRNSVGDPIPALECSQRLTVGYGGVGDFQVLGDAGAIVSGALIVGTDPDAPAGTYSEVLVDGTDSSLEVLGKDGDGSATGMEIGRQGQANLLSITNGGQVISEYDASIGGSPDGEGILLVDGLDSFLAPRLQFEVGRDGPGEATVSNGGRIHVDGSNSDPEWGEGFKGLTFIGMRSTGTLTITGRISETPSSLESNAQIVVGVNTGGNGTLIIDQGAEVLSWKHVSATNTAGIIGREAGCSGHVTVKDGARWDMPDGGLTVGWLGTGRLDLTSGSLVSTYGIIGRQPGSEGEVQISSTLGSYPSSWDINGSLAIGGDLAGNAGGTGRLLIDQDCWVWTSGSTTIHGPGTLSLADGRLDTSAVDLGGTIEGFGWLVTPVTNTAGVMHPSDLGVGGAREIALGGSYVQQSGGTLLIDVAGNDDYGRLRAWDAAHSQTLAGTLRVRIINGYVPPFGSAFDIAYAEGGVSAAFDTIDLPTIDGQPVFELYMENPNTLRMRTILEYYAPVDTDHDGDVDDSDRDAFESCATGPGIVSDDQDCAWADLDNDTDIDQTDFSVFQRCYGGEGVPVNADCAN